MQCNVIGCGEPTKFKGKCRYHYQRDYRLEHVSQVRCVECGNPAQARQLCPTHYQQARRAGRVMPSTTRFRPDGGCAVVGCDTPAVVRGRCRYHYHHDWRNQKGVSIVIRRVYLADRGGTCDLCGTPIDANKAHLDHDHDCCDGQGARHGSGCIKCVRGLLCARCNHVEGMARVGFQSGIITGIWGPLADYLSDPPMQRWLRERDAEEDTPLAA